MVLEKVLGIINIEETLEHVKVHHEDNYTGTYIFDLQEVYKMYLFLNDWKDDNESKNSFYYQMEITNFPSCIAFI